MSERANWKFEYDTSVVLAAAQAKLAFHTERLAWWLNQSDEVKAKITTEGIQINESVAERAGSVSNSYSAFRDASVSVRHDLVTDMNETQAKVAEHRGKVKEYDGWVQFLGAATNTKLPLNHTDWLFFFNTK